MITVRCGSCGETFPEDAVEIDDIEEGSRGEDIVTFICPHCGETTKSRRYG